MSERLSFILSHALVWLAGVGFGLLIAEMWR